MRAINTTVAAIFVALSAAAFASQALAQDSAERDAAIAKCAKQAQTQFPNDGGTQEAQRTAAYKACMAAGGHRA